MASHLSVRAKTVDFFVGKIKLGPNHLRTYWERLLKLSTSLIKQPHGDAVINRHITPTELPGEKEPKKDSKQEQQEYSIDRDQGLSRLPRALERQSGSTAYIKTTKANPSQNAEHQGAQLLDKSHPTDRLTS